MENVNSLNKNWFIDGWIDFEYKKYELLAYLKKVDKLFNQTKLYPYFSDLINHYSNLNHYIKNQKDFKTNFKRNLNSIDLKNLELNFKTKFKEHEIIEEMLSIINFAQKELKNSIEQGEELYEFIFSKMTIDSVGLIPFYNKEGYLIVTKNGYLKNKKRHGNWISYQPSGKKSAMGTYQSDLKIGQWFFWNQDDLIEVIYEKNKIVNVLEWNNSDKKLIAKNN